MSRRTYRVRELDEPGWTEIADLADDSCEAAELCVSVYVSNVGDVEAAIGRLCTEIDAGVAARRASEVE